MTELDRTRMDLEQAERNLRRRQEDFNEAPGMLGRQAALYRAYDELDRLREEVARLEREATRPDGAETRHTETESTPLAHAKEIDHA